MTWRQEQIEQIEIGKEIGEKIGEKVGEERSEDNTIIKMLKKNKTIEYISDLLDFSIERVTAVAKANGYA